MERIKFWIALWAGKICIYVFKLIGRQFDDKPGMLAMKICYHFMTYVNKPKLNIIVTGTNGKTTVTYLLANLLIKDNKKVVYNTWGANTNAGQAYCLLESVSFFNKPTADAVILESDELMSSFAFPQLNPDYIIVTNIARDSMFRNASPDYIFGKLKDGIANSRNATVILNADDPISSQLEVEGRTAYFGVCDLHKPIYRHHIDDFAYCTICGATPQYNYRNYRHIGEYFCPKCGFKTPERDYFISKVNDGTFTVTEHSNEQSEYPSLSDDVHNLYNLASVIALMRTLGYQPEKITALLKQIKLPGSREFSTRVNGVDVICKTLKTQNSTGTSVTMESLAAEKEKMIVIVDMDEEFTGDRSHLCEVGTYLYDIDYEFLNKPNLSQLIIAGDRCYDHQIRALLSGVPKEKITTTLKNIDAWKFVDLKDVKKVFVLKNNFGDASSRFVFDQIVKKLEGKEI